MDKAQVKGQIHGSLGDTLALSALDSHLNIQVGLHHPHPNRIPYQSQKTLLLHLQTFVGHHGSIHQPTKSHNRHYRQLPCAPHGRSLGLDHCQPSTSQCVGQRSNHHQERGICGRIQTRNPPVHLDPTERSPTPRDDTHHGNTALHLVSADTPHSIKSHAHLNHGGRGGHHDTDTHTDAHPCRHQRSIHGQMLSHTRRVASLHALSVVAMPGQVPI